jgi:PEGA domain
MKRRWLIVVCLLMSLSALAADLWQYGRIGDVHKSVSTKTKAWVVNTPINEDQTSYTISVHVADKLLVGNYELTPEESAPPQEWTTNYPVKVQLQGDTMYVRSPMGDVRLHIVRRKTSQLMAPLTPEEKKGLEQMEAPAQSLVGFSESSSKPTDDKPKPETAPQPPPPPANVGSVTVRSTPYLSEVFVDGDSMGYTPAKINLAPGKHAFRVEKAGYKAWTKEMMVTAGSELTLDASLEKK